MSNPPQTLGSVAVLWSDCDTKTEVEQVSRHEQWLTIPRHSFWMAPSICSDHRRKLQITTLNKNCKTKFNAEDLQWLPPVCGKCFPNCYLTQLQASWKLSATFNHFSVAKMNTCRALQQKVSKILGPAVPQSWSTYILDIDQCDKEIGHLHLQKQPNIHGKTNGNCSLSNNGAEHTCNITQGESLVVVWAVFSICPFRNRSLFAICTDNETLEEILSLMDPTDRLACMQLRSWGSKIDVLHCLGTNHYASDASYSSNDRKWQNFGQKQHDRYLS